jgi:hypothetical protein
MPFPKLPPGGTVASRRHYSVVDNYGDIPTELSSYTLIQVQHFVLNRISALNATHWLADATERCAAGRWARWGW